MSFSAVQDFGFILTAASKTPLMSINFRCYVIGFSENALQHLKTICTLPILSACKRTPKHFKLAAFGSNPRVRRGHEKHRSSEGCRYELYLCRKRWVLWFDGLWCVGSVN
ncbi:hypothetical protein CHARACLAT_019145 [Characodon lateralis]|uniref:Uncharacterized protein n=1 Tax=Characodon lateralis TaxID=208331 RepID=A0ABU7CPE0_9TELE|nr:hypothetical protein [Characodon lateralis]